MGVRQITHAGRRRGRPPLRAESETRGLIIAAARREFLSRGYAMTSMNTVARNAGVSTKTLYRLVPTKADLFAAVVTERIGSFIPQIDEEALAGLGLREGLERILGAFGALTLDPETIALQRVVIGESDRFPEIAATFYEAAILRTRDAMTAWLARQRAAGLIRLDDPEEAAGMLRGMMIMEPQRAVMLRQRPAPTPSEIAARAGAVARLFLEGCKTV